jgi:mRNA interferase MazF
MHKGKIVLIPFPFTDLSGQKVRPAVILNSQNKKEDCIVCFVSSVKNSKLDTFDIKVKANTKNGLKIDSIIKISKIATLDKKTILGELGELDKEIISIIDTKLKKLFDNE